MIIYLIDTSAAARILTNPTVQQQWRDELGAGVIGICDPVELEMLYSARSLADRLDKKATIEELFSWVPAPDGVWARAHQQQLLTDRGEHRSAGTADLLIAAIAELQRLVVLHHDRDFDTVAEATGQPAVWVAKPGTVT